MELNEAIDNINLLITNLENMSVKEIEPENYILLNSLNTVLEELNNSISKNKIENKIKELKEKLENVRNKEDRIRNGVAIIVLEYCIDSMNELLEDKE